MAWIRTCQSCGNKQEDDKIPEVNKPVTIAFANRKCKKCKSSDLDYGRSKMDAKIHHLIITPKTARTSCGQDIIAFYPMSLSAMLAEAGAEPISVRLVKAGVTCEVCKKKAKEE